MTEALPQTPVSVQLTNQIHIPAPMTTPTEWKAEIARIVHWKQIAAEHDKRRALPWSLPKVGANPGQILQAEKRLGVPFSTEFKELLLLANGWKGFCVLTDLFGTEDFLSGRAEEVRKRPEVTGFIRRRRLAINDVVPIGASDAELDVFLLVSPKSAIEPGVVLWWANEEIERFPTFRAFFAAMVNYNAQVATRLVQRS